MKLLSKEQHHILKEKGTEPPFSSPLNSNKSSGSYYCVACGEKLFSSEKKFDSGTGWPSFFDTESSSVSTKKDFSAIFPRTEVLCKKCGSHLGHVFNDGPQPTGKRYCINGLALDFKKKDGKKIF